MARKNRKDTENTRIMILQSALDCFYKKGFSRTTFDEIASGINLTKGAVYWHFKNKADLLVALIMKYINTKTAEIGDKHTCPKNLNELKLFFLQEANYIKSNEKAKKFIFFIFFQVEWSDTVFNKVISEMGEVRQYHLKTIKQALLYSQKDGEIDTSHDMDLTALIILSFWRGLVNTYVSEEKTDFIATLDKGLDIIINSIRKQKG